MSGKPSFKAGDVLPGPVRAITAQRIEWYDRARDSLPPMPTG